MYIENIKDFLKDLIINHDGLPPVNLKSKSKIKPIRKKKHFHFTKEEIIERLVRINNLLDIICTKLDIQM